MRLKCIKHLGLGLALAAGLTLTAKAQVDYVWVPAAGNSQVTTGTLTESGGTVTSFTFTETGFGPIDPDLQTFTLGGFTATPTGIVLASDGNFQIKPTDININGLGYVLSFVPNGSGPASNEQRVNDNGAQYGDWVAVPEPASMISAALMLLPFGASTLRILGRKRVA